MPINYILEFLLLLDLALSLDLFLLLLLFGHPFLLLFLLPPHTFLLLLLLPLLLQCPLKGFLLFRSEFYLGLLLFGRFLLVEQSMFLAEVELKDFLLGGILLFLFLMGLQQLGPL